MNQSGDGAADGAEPSTEPASAKPAAKPAVDTHSTEDAHPQDAEDASNRIAVAMRARVQAQRTRNEAEAAARQLMAQVEQERAQLEESRRSITTQLRERPIDALRALGIDPREFFERAVEDPQQLDPVRQVEAKIAAELKQLREQNETLRQSFEQRQQEEQQRAIRSQQEQARQQFVSDAFDGESFPTLKALYSDDPDKLTQEAIGVIREYQARGGDASELSNKEIAEFLEGREYKRYSAIKSRLELAGSETTQSAGGNVSLTNKSTSAKNTRSRKAVSELSAEEARAEAVRLFGEGMSGR